jgi:chemoreceptor zinc-binding protein
MDLESAIGAHAEWKTKLRSASDKKEHMDVAAISADNSCALGKWLHGDGKAKYGSLRAYKDCLDSHAQFHVEAGKVAAMVNQAKFNDTLIGAGSAFGAASNHVGSAIIHLKKEAKL